MSTTVSLIAVVTPTEELLSLRGAALKAIESALLEAVEKMLDTPDGPALASLKAEMSRLREQRGLMLAQNIAIISASPEVQAALKRLATITSDLQKAAARLETATDFVNKLGKGAGFGKKALDGIEKVKAEAKKVIG